MLNDYLRRGLAAGSLGGLVYGLFVAFVGTPLITFAETFEQSHGHGHEAAGPAVSATVTTGVSVLGGVVAGVFLGTIVFGLAYYFLEPAIPGARDTKSYLLGAAGFVTVSGAPWLLLPPQPPGVEQSLPTEVRLPWYVAMMAVGALACGLAGYAFQRLRAHSIAIRILGVVGALALVPIVATLGPNSVVSGPIPEGLATAFRAVVATGQLLLWTVLASAHGWLVRRDDDDPLDPIETNPREQPMTAD
jgi:predicted cobalt transporter CbtA